jgi:DNA polymerase sigma
LKLNFDFTFLEVDDIDKDQIIPSQKIIKFIKDSIIIYPNIKPIILILKRYMQIQKLNSSYHGGISSFSLFLLLASYNKQLFNENKLLDKNKDFENLLGQILYGFFMFYSNFNFEIHSIDLNKNNPFILLEEFNESNITLIDPITGLNAAKSTFKLDQIKFAFNNAILRINEIFFNNINSIKNNNDENNIIKELFTTNNFTNYFY